VKLNIEVYFVKTDEIYINRNKVVDIINFLVTSENYITGNISIIFTSDRYLAKINKDYLGHNYYTDTISFPAVYKKKVSGDIYISLNAIKQNAIKYSNGIFESELFRIIIHGVLHLCGHSDSTIEERKLMTEKENFYLKKLNLQF
jgi:rRNA maturation RNase YbeY